MGAAVFQVKISNTDERFPCRVDQSILDGMSQQIGRKGIPVGCRGGGCGVCKVEVLSGRYERKVMTRAHVSTDDESQGKVLACRIFPRSDLELRVIGTMKLSGFSQVTSERT